MKEINDLPVYEGQDICALDEYSAKMAEKVHKKIEDSKYNDTTINKKISDLQQENKTQTEEITKLKQEKEELEKIVESILPNGQVEGEYITIKDSANYPCKVTVEGNSWQEDTENISPQNPSKIRNVGDNVNLINKNEKLNFSTYGSSVADTVLQANANYTGYLFKCKPNTSYTISRADTKSERFRGFCFDEDPTKNLQAKSTNGFWADAVAGGSKTQKTFSTTENSKYIYVSAGYNNILSANVKAEEGEKATSYSPYNCGNIVLSMCNENLQKNKWEQLDATGTSVDVSNIKFNNNDVIVVWLKTTDNLEGKSLYLDKVGLSRLFVANFRKRNDRYVATFTVTSDKLQYLNNVDSKFTIYASTRNRCYKYKRNNDNKR